VRRDRLAVLFQGLIVFFSLSGVAVNLWVASGGPEPWNIFSYYTLQSNLLAAAALLPGLRLRLAGKPEPPALVIFKSGALLWILVTGVIYNLLLAGRWQPEGAMVYVNLTLHYFTPLGMLLNWILFEEKGRLKPAYLLAWMAYPLLYMLGSWVRGALTGFYPYWFLNPSAPYPRGAGSVGEMLVLVGVITLGFVLAGLLILLLDRLASR
jgi:hypothetical protein